MASFGCIQQLIYFSPYPFHKLCIKKLLPNKHIFHTHTQNRRGVISEGSQSSNSNITDEDDKVIITKRGTIWAFTISRHVQNIFTSPGSFNPHKNPVR